MRTISVLAAATFLALLGAAGGVINTVEMALVVVGTVIEQPWLPCRP